MSVANVGLDQAVGLSGLRASARQANQDFEQLVQSLKSGNLSAAQQAYNSFQQIQPGQATSAATPAAGVAATSAATPAATPVAADWSALGQALQSGSLSSAQGALGKLQQDGQSAWQAHVQNARMVYALMQGVQGAAATSGQTSASPVQSDLNALSQALQSGDTSGAQKLLAQLEQDLQTTGQASGQPHGGHHHHRHGGLSGLNAASGTPGTTPLSAASPTSTAATGAASSTVTGAVG